MSENRKRREWPGRPDRRPRPGNPGAPVRRNAPRPMATARDVALDACIAVDRDRAYASQALDRALMQARLSPEDRRLAASLFYSCLENRIRIDHQLDHLIDTRPDPMTWNVLRVAAAQILVLTRVPDHAAVDEAVKQVRQRHRESMDKLVNGVLRSLIRARDGGTLAMPDRESEPEAWLSVRCSVSEAAARRVAAGYGLEQAEEILSYIPAERTVTVRPNRMRMDAEALNDVLTQAGGRVSRGVLEDALTVAGIGNPAALPEYAKGLFSIQSEGSMLAARAVEPKPGMQILEACAAPGGKTCYMAELMRGTGHVHAWDVYPHRVELIRASARRLQLENVRPAEHDARRPAPAMADMMDAVLVDAPCSGLGVLNEKPDIRFRVTEEEIEGLLPVQAAILDNASRCVRPEGLLVYSTCTILPEENAAQVRAFLDTHPDFELILDDRWLPEALRPRMEQGMLQLLPSRDGVEGFFIARMRRRRG